MGGLHTAYARNAIEATAQFAKSGAGALDDRAGAAHGIMHAPLAFEVMDQRVDRGGLKRIAADEQGMKAEDAAE